MKTLFDVMKKDNFNIIYEALFAIWNISNFVENVEIFESKRDQYLETIVSVIKTNKIDKIARVGLMIIKVKIQYFSYLIFFRICLFHKNA